MNRFHFLMVVMLMHQCSLYAQEVIPFKTADGVLFNLSKKAVEQSKKLKELLSTVNIEKEPVLVDINYAALSKPIEALRLLDEVNTVGASKLTMLLQDETMGDMAEHIKVADAFGLPKVVDNVWSMYLALRLTNKDVCELKPIQESLPYHLWDYIDLQRVGYQQVKDLFT